HRRRLPRAGPRRQAEVLMHGVKDAALDGLETVAHVGERARGDDAQRVAEVPLLCRGPEIRLEWKACSVPHRPPPVPTAGGILAAPTTKARPISGIPARLKRSRSRVQRRRAAPSTRNRDARGGTVLARRSARAEGVQRMVIQLLLSTGDPDAN